MTIGVCVAGATGWAGRPVAEAVLRARDLELVSAVSRSSAGRDLGEAWGGQRIGVPVHGRVDDALDGVQVLVDYTSHAAVREHVLLALARGVHVVVGSSGLSGEELGEIDAAARAARLGVFAGGNYSLTATLLLKAALMVAEFLPSWEIIDYAHAGKPDAPSGTSRELAERLAQVRRPAVEVSLSETAGVSGARGATVAGTQIHSLRLPSYELSTEVVFGLPGERLVLRHDGGPSPDKFVAGTLIALRDVPDTIGVSRGLDIRPQPGQLRVEPDDGAP